MKPNDNSVIHRVTIKVRSYSSFSISRRKEKKDRDYLISYIFIIYDNRVAKIFPETWTKKEGVGISPTP